MTDFSPTAGDYARHRAGFPPALIERLARTTAPGRPVLDLGTGTGTLALGLARSGFDVTGIDIGAPMLAEANRLASEEALDVRFIEAPAEATGFEDEQFDLITAGQCWHWFDRAKVARECRRMLTPGGTVAIAHLDWLRFDDNIVDLTLRVMAEFGTGFLDFSHAGSEGIYPAWTRDLREANLEGVETFSFDLDLTYSHLDWRGRIRASYAVGGRLEPDGVARFDALLASRIESRQDPFMVPHRVWAVTAKRPS